MKCNFSKIEEEILTNSKLLKIKGFPKSKGFSKLDKLILQLLDKQKHNCTLFLNNEIQCDEDKRRSTEDIFLLCKYYKPDCTFKEVVKTLGKLSKKDIYGCYCFDINKVTFILSDSPKYAGFSYYNYHPVYLGLKPIDYK